MALESKPAVLLIVVVGVAVSSNHLALREEVLGSCWRTTTALASARGWSIIVVLLVLLFLAAVVLVVLVAVLAVAVVVPVLLLPVGAKV